MYVHLRESIVWFILFICASQVNGTSVIRREVDALTFASSTQVIQQNTEMVNNYKIQA